MNIKVVLCLCLIGCFLVGSVSACGYGKYQRECKIVINPPIDATQYNVRHMSFIDDSLIEGMDDMRSTYQMYKALEEQKNTQVECQNGVCP